MGVGGSRQRRMTDDTDAKIYPTMAWRIAIGDTKVCVVEIQYARDMAELQIGAAGGELPSVPLGMTTTSRAEVRWLTETIGCIFPEAWTAFEQTANRRPGESVIDAYYRLIRDRDRKVREQAAEAWCKWEDAIVSLDPQAKPSARFADPNFRMNFATLVIHYFANAAFLEGREILKNMGRIAHLPGVLIHGRLDVSGPLHTAWQLHQLWSESQLIVVETEGHGGAIVLENRDQGGLRARMHLPRMAARA